MYRVNESKWRDNNKLNLWMELEFGSFFFLPPTVFRLECLDLFLFTRESGKKR